MIRTVACLMLGVSVSLLGAASAAAHEGEGVLTVEVQEPIPSGARLVVGLVWANDGHPAVDATVTATPVAPDGAPGTPVVLTEVDGGAGRYQGEVPLPAPGTWTVRVTAVSPAATVELSQVVAAPSGTEPSTTASTQTAPTTADRPATAEVDGEETAAGDDGGSGAAAAIAIAVLVVVVVAAVAGFSRSRRRLEETT